MRVTHQTNFETIRDSIRRSRGRMEDLQHQNATLKKLNTPSDDPVAATKILEIRTDKVNNEQFQMNAKLAESYLNNTDHALSEISEIMVRAKEIAVGQSSGASANDDTRLGVAEEVNQLFQQAVATANKRIGERYLFGGYRTHRQPFDADGKYLGDDGQMMTEIGKGIFLNMNISGHEAFNSKPQGIQDGQVRQPNRSPAEDGESDLSGPEQENVNAFDEIQNLRIALLSGDTEGIRGTLERLDEIHAKLISVRSKIGSRIQGLQSAITATERHNLTNAQLNAALEDADMAQVVSDLAKEETVFRSALASSQRLIQPTLLDFLK